MIETPAHACRCVQSYSSWSCSPAELHYASDCGAKIQNPLFNTKNLKMKYSLQFELLNTYYSKITCNLSYTPKKIRGDSWNSWLIINSWDSWFKKIRGFS